MQYRRKLALMGALFIVPTFAFADYNLDSEFNALLDSQNVRQQIIDFEAQFGTTATCATVLPTEIDYANKQAKIANDTLQKFNDIGCTTYDCQNMFNDVAGASKKYLDLAKQLITVYSDVCLTNNYPALPYPPPPPSAPSCPSHASPSGGSCTCDNGYLNVNNACISYNDSCVATYGQHSYGDKTSCYCGYGYQFNASKTACISVPVTPPQAPVSFSPPTRTGTSTACLQLTGGARASCMRTVRSSCRQQYPTNAAGYATCYRKGLRG